MIIARIVERVKEYILVLDNLNSIDYYDETSELTFSTKDRNRLVTLDRGTTAKAVWEHLHNSLSQIYEGRMPSAACRVTIDLSRFQQTDGES